MNSRDKAPPAEVSAAAWTWAGDGSPLDTPAVSPLSIRTRLDALAATGWRYFGLDLADVRSTEVPLDQLPAEVRERGLQCLELEFLIDWWVPSGPRRADADRACEELLYAASVLACDLVKIGSAFDDDMSSTPATIVDGLNRLARRAEGTGVRFALEPMPFARVRDPAVAQQLLDDCDPAVGLCVDVCHVARAEMPYADLDAVLDPSRVFRVELADGHRVPRGTVREDSVNHRLLPGRGDLKVADFVAEMTALGWSGVWGVEVLSAELRATPLPESLAAVRRASLQLFDRAHTPPGATGASERNQTCG